jgi:hypothetical protein
MQPEPKVQVMILGTYHMHNPGADLVKADLDDHLSPKRQEQILDLVERMAKFQPTKIAVELPYGSTRVNERFGQFKKGEYTLTANEIDQVGMRLAMKLGHSQLYPFDHQLGMDFDKMFAFAQETGDTEFLGYMGKMQAYIKETLMDPIPKQTLVETLRKMNDPAMMQMGTSPYLRMARLGKNDQYVGADVVGQWYLRNIRMYSNLWRFAKPGDRVLVIVGSGHAPILRQLVGDTEEMALVEAIEYLR